MCAQGGKGRIKGSHGGELVPSLEWLLWQREITWQQSPRREATWRKIQGLPWQPAPQSPLRALGGGFIMGVPPQLKIWSLINSHCTQPAEGRSGTVLFL